MKAMILAAGFGTRLRPMTNDLPKPLLPVGGRPLLYYNLYLLRKYGITDVFINVHYHGDKIIKAVGDGSRFGLHITYSEEADILGTGGGIKKIASEISEETFMVINGDILVDLNLNDVVASHRKQGGRATLVLREDKDVERFGAIEVDEDGQIQNMLGRMPWRGQTLKKLMFAGIHVMEPDVLDYIPTGFYSITDVYLQMLVQREQLYGYVMRGYWSDIGVLERYQATDCDLRQGKVHLSYI